MPKTFLFVTLVATMLAGTAYAQKPDAPLTGRSAGPGLPPATQTPAERVRPSADAPPKDQSLSDKLQQNDGVIKPPANGTTGTVVKPDQSGSMPVIKPSELPGRTPGTEAK